MSKLDELINKLCPNGVQFRPFYDVIERVNERAKENSNSIPVFVVSSKLGLVPFEVYRGDNSSAKPSDDKSNYLVVRKNEFAYNPARLNIGSLSLMEHEKCLISPMYVAFKVRHDSGLLVKFVSYFLKTSYVFRMIDSYKENGARFRFDFSNWSRIMIPIPPIEIQKEIVCILDSFVELNSILNRELECRNLQYLHYLDLQFQSCGGDKKTLSEIGTFTRGKRFVHADAVKENGIPCIHYGELYTHYGVYSDNAISQIRKSILYEKKLRYANKGNVIIVGAGENNEDIGIGLSWEGNYPVAVHDACYAYETNYNPRFISFFLRSTSYHQQIKTYVSEGKICAISSDGIGRAELFVPNISKQDEIVKKLDSFYKLVFESLPYEIELRTKQYECYRDKLLTFKEAE